MAEETALDRPADLGQMLRDRVRNLFAELIPDEKLDAMITAEWDRFTKPTRRAGRYQNDYETVPSELQQMVTKVVQDRVKAQMDRVVQDHVWNGEITDEFMHGLITAAIPGVARAFTEMLARNACKAAQEIMQRGY